MLLTAVCAIQRVKLPSTTPDLRDLPDLREEKEKEAMLPLFSPYISSFSFFCFFFGTLEYVTKMRILMLPGYTQSASILYQRLGSIRKGLSDLPIELIFIDPVCSFLPSPPSLCLKLRLTHALSPARRLIS